jgi:hypothetical protein
MDIIRKDANWDLIPDYMQDGLKLYFNEGIKPGDFLYLMLSGDINTAFQHADPVNKSRVPDYLRFFGTYAPPGSWGTSKKVEEWMEARRKENKISI